MRYTCFGEYGDQNEQPFDLTVMRSYVSELLGYKNEMKRCAWDAFQSLIFWRGQVKVFDMLLPVHSYLFFTFATNLVERPHLFPPFFLISVAWILLAFQTQRLQHPSPWSRCHSFRHYVEILKNGKSPHPIHSIEPQEGAKEAEAYEKEYQERIEKDQKIAAQMSQMQQKIADMGDDSIHTKITTGIPLDLMVRLTRYQAIVGRLCQKARFVRIIISWEDSVVSFWVTACFLGAGIVSLILPWSFILRWFFRIFVWGLFGPHMKLLDWTMQSNAQDENILEDAVEKFQKRSLAANRRRQDAVKLKDMKTITFGQYSALVPSYNLSRHFDRPLPDSFASSHPNRSSDMKFGSQRILGQQFFGVILPRTQEEASLYEEELPKIQHLQAALETCVKELCESEYPELSKRLQSQSMDLSVEPDAESLSLLETCEPNISIVQREKKASNQRRRSSTYRGGYELISMAEECEEDTCADFKRPSIGTSGSLQFDSKRQWAAETEEREASIARSSSPGNEKKDGCREPGDIEVVLFSSKTTEKPLEEDSGINDHRGDASESEVDEIENSSTAYLLYYKPTRDSGIEEQVDISDDRTNLDDSFEPAKGITVVL
jgi:hypothetical protein